MIGGRHVGLTRTVHRLALSPTPHTKLVFNEEYEGSVMAKVFKADQRAAGKALYYMAMHCVTAVLAGLALGLGPVQFNLESNSQ
ncbi:hypothetical protein QQP08_003081 [Theobroma cacao]|nr:hypothetical protein QQP08_003081 [Theobroma cacao]